MKASALKENQLQLQVVKIYYILFTHFLSLTVCYSKLLQSCFHFFDSLSLIPSLSSPLSLLSHRQSNACVVEVWIIWWLDTCGGGIMGFCQVLGFLLGFGASSFCGFLLGFGGGVVVTVAVWKREIDDGRVWVCDLGLALVG